MKFCRHCGSEMQDTATVCVKCGIAENVAPSGVAYCFHCGIQMDPRATICVKCGMTQNLGNSSKNSASEKKLYRVREGKLLAGVCTGLGRYTEVNAWVFRVLFIIFGCSLLGIIVYIVLACAFKYEDEQDNFQSNATASNAASTDADIEIVYCMNCGHAMPHTAKFCSYCGAPNHTPPT